MTLSDQDYFDLIIAQVGGDTADGLLDGTLPTLWELRASIADVPARVLWTRLDALDLLLAQSARQVTFRTSSGSQVNLSDLFDHFKELRANTLSLLGGTVPDSGAAVGLLSQTAPIMRDRVGQLDPNARRLRGDPLRRRH